MVTEQDVRSAVAAAPVIVPVGARTHWEVGGSPLLGTEVRAPAGVVAYEPDDLTVTVGAGTSIAELDRVLAARHQECVLDPRDPSATVGGVLATGLSGHRRLRHGPVRDQVLEVRFVTGDAMVVRGGGPTVKNVTGFDLPRLLVGSLGTLGVLTRAILRCRPRPPRAQWATSADAPGLVARRCTRPSSVLFDGAGTWVLLEGHDDEVTAELRRGGLEAVPGAPGWPGGEHRGRISVATSRLEPVARALRRIDGVGMLAEWGVGTVHVAAPTEAALGAARVAAEREGGWLLREAGAPGLDGFGRGLPNPALMVRLRDAFDPAHKCAPGRLPLVEGESGL